MPSSRGHLLVSLPGQENPLAKAISKLCGLAVGRIQATSDLLPADILGVSIFSKQTQTFEFHKGPIFAEILLFDEINRTSPKTQSALLQAMEERTITVDRSTHRLPSPFFVIATQNPHDQVGTFPLPSSQLDRFLMRIEIGFPSREMEKEILEKDPADQLLGALEEVIKEEVVDMQKEVRKVFVHDDILETVQDIIERSRKLTIGISTRGAQALVRVAKAWAFLDGRTFVIPEDVIAVADCVLRHRIQGSMPEQLENLMEKICYGET